jgi:hypothetical protein
VNCWEFMKCGREKGGINADRLGICPAYPNDGRRCARVAGTFCEGKIHGSFAIRLKDCMKCEFYRSPHYARGDDKR